MQHFALLLCFLRPERQSKVPSSRTTLPCLQAVGLFRVRGAKILGHKQRGSFGHGQKGHIKAAQCHNATMPTQGGGKHKKPHQSTRKNKVSWSFHGYSWAIHGSETVEVLSSSGPWWNAHHSSASDGRSPLEPLAVFNFPDHVSETPQPLFFHLTNCGYRSQDLQKVHSAIDFTWCYVRNKLKDQNCYTWGHFGWIPVQWSWQQNVCDYPRSSRINVSAGYCDKSNSMIVSCFR